MNAPLSGNPIRATTIAAIVCWSLLAHAAEPEYSRVFPRFTLLQLQYPQAVAVSAGSWVRLWGSAEQVGGLVGDAELGLSGASVKLGLGASSSESVNYERGWSFGVQATALRTWPWWSPWLPTSATFAGGELFAAFSMYRCSVGAMWAFSADASPRLVGGCGLGLP